MMNARIGTALLILALLMSSCSGESPPPSGQQSQPELSVLELPESKTQNIGITYDEILQIAQSNHAFLFTPLTNARLEEFNSRFRAIIDVEKDRATASKISALYQNGVSAADTVTQQQACEDVNFLMDYLECGYSGYAFYGGDETFAPLREKLLAEVGKMSETISRGDFINCLQDILYPAIADRHLTVANNRELDKSMPYVATESVFHYNKGRYVEMETDKILESVLVDGVRHTPDEVLVPWLELDGQMDYRLVVNAQNVPSVFLLSEGGDSREIKLRPVGTSSPRTDTDSLWELELHGDIPVLRCYSLYPLNEDGNTSLEEFAHSAAALRDEPYIIMDLRGNGGGMASYGAQWISELTDFEPGYFEGNSVTATVFSETSFANYPSSIYGTWYYDLLQDFRANGEFPGYSIQCDMQPRVPVETNQTIFVLLDKNSGSAAEYFANYLSMLTNTVLVGCNSAGQFHFGLNVGLPLPNSGVEIRSAMNVFLFPDLQLHENVGFSPDIWCDTENSMDAVLGLIGKMKYEESFK